MISYTRSRTYFKIQIRVAYVQGGSAGWDRERLHANNQALVPGLQALYKYRRYYLTKKNILKKSAKGQKGLKLDP